MYSKQRQGDAKELAVAALAVVSANLAHLFTFWNRFLGAPVTGMFYEFAVLLRRGLVPYRDFYIVVPPLYVFKTAAMIALFGPGILPQRFVEVVTRCAIAVVLLLWLRRVTTTSNALVGTICAIVMFSSDLSDPITFYHSDAVIWAVIGGLLLSFLCGRKLDWLLIAGSGVCSALSLMAAQTVGVGISLSLLVVVCILGFWAAGVRGLVKYVLLYAAGWAVPSGALLLWLAHAGAATAFLRIIFVTGPSSKGSIFSILLRFLGGPFSFHIPGLDNVIALTCAIGLIALIAQRKDPASQGEPNALRWSYICLCFCGIAAGALLAELSAYPHAWWRLFEIENIVLRAGVFCSIALAGYYTFRALLRLPSDSEKQRWILSVVAFATSYALAMSWPAYGMMAFPSLAVAIGFGMEALGGRSFGTRAQYALVGAVSVLMLIAEYQRAMMPFNWLGWIDSPVRRATTTIPLAPLQGIYVDSQTKKFVLSLTRLIKEHARPSEPVFIFPYQALFYALADRWPPTLAQVHYFDVAPDELCREDAKRLVNAKPAVIVDFAASPMLFESMENQFRRGKRSGQRDLYEAMYRLIEQEYHLASVMHQPGSDEEVRVFVRNGR